MAFYKKLKYTTMVTRKGWLFLFVILAVIPVDIH